MKLTAPVSHSREVHDQKAAAATPIRKSSLAPVVPALIFGVLYYGLLAVEPLSSCRMARERLVGAFAEPYSGTETDPNLLEPVALALARKRITRCVDERSPLECAAILYRLWISPEEIRITMRGENQ